MPSQSIIRSATDFGD